MSGAARRRLPGQKAGEPAESDPVKSRTERQGWRRWAGDIRAAATSAVATVPDAMAASLLAGVNPVHGFYTSIVATPVGALATGSVFMTVTTTGALAVATGEALAAVPPAQRAGALVTLTILAGAFQLLMGVLKLGQLTRFISHAVMTGFLSGIGVLIILSQVGDLTGFTSDAGHKLLQTVDLLRHLHEVDPPTLLAGTATIALIVGLERTPLRAYAMLLALAAVAFLTNLLGWDSISRVGDVAALPRGLHAPRLPDLGLVVSLLLPAVGLAVVGLVQGAGISHSQPNPDGEYPDVSRDFVGQGLANVAGGLMQGLPAGGSLGGTQITVNAGARSRWANLLTAPLVALAVMLLATWIERLPLAALSGLLVLAGFRTLRFARITTVFRTGWSSAFGMILTFASTLLLPMQWAIMVGVATSFALFVVRSAYDVSVRAITLVDGMPRESPAPHTLASGQVCPLLMYGSLFFAGARTLEEALPHPGSARGAVVLLLMRGRGDVGSTFVDVITRYARELRTQRCRLMLVGVDRSVRLQLERTGALGILGEENVFPATSTYGEALFTAYAAAQAWAERERG